MGKSAESFMRRALAEAKKAETLGEVPVGAVIVHDGRVIARGHNRTQTDRDPTAHAEMIAIREAAKVLGGWRLPDCVMFVTLEPCSMCAGAIVWSRIDRLIIGAMDPKAGACGSVFNIPQERKLNHYTQIETGLLADECGGLLKAFFRERRKQNNTDKSEDTRE
ncbi:MAG: tRNA adenosine(34) deaminase TadA [Bacillota bacterium]|nr:tRNA adenosine(34) deaminase TadA [Bacillota bacterium]